MKSSYGKGPADTAGPTPGRRWPRGPCLAVVVAVVVSLSASRSAPAARGCRAGKDRVPPNVVRKSA